MRYVLTRLGHSVAVVVAVLVLVFFIGHTVGDPARLMLPLTASQEQVDVVRESLGLNDSIWQQFGRFLTDAAQGDFGVSIWQDVPAIDLVLERLPATLVLAGATLLVVGPLGIALGSAAAVRRNSLFDRIVRVASACGVAMVEFWLALMLVLLFAVNLGWLPTSGYGSFRNLVLPVATLSVRPLCRMVQVTRSAMAQESSKLYVDALDAKGIGPARRTYVHMLRNAGIPVVTVLGDELIALIGGVIIVETVFSWPGVGQLMIEAINRRDLPLIQAAVFVLALTVVFINVVVDLTYVRLNPRMRLAA